jgi:DNA-binding transcriptional LysR family regulator
MLIQRSSVLPVRREAPPPAPSLREVNLAGVDLNLLVALDALLAERSVTLAANRVGLSQPAMSRALGRLRDLLEDKLLVRTSSGLAPTPRAEVLAQSLPQTLASIRQMISAPEFEPQRWRATVTLALLDYHALVLLPRLLPRLKRRAPGLDLDVQPLAAEPFARLEAGETDLVLGCFEAAPPGFYRRTLVSEELVCLLRRDHPALARDWTAEAFAELDHVQVSPPGPAGTDPVEAALAAAGLARRSVVRLPYLVTAPMILAESDMVLTVPRRIAEQAVASLPLVLVEPPLTLPPFIVSALWHERRHRDKEQVWLRSEIAAASLSVMQSQTEERRP